MALPPEVLAEIAAAREELTALLKSEKHRDCGFKRGDEELVKREDGTLNEAEVLRNTFFECHDCGSAWKDDGEFGPTRIALDQSSQYIAARPDALPTNLGFNFPQWINRRLPWGQMMLDYLKAKIAVDRFGHLGLLQIWWQKTAARTWSPSLTKTLRAQTYEKYDAKSDWAEEWLGHRAFIIDCQQDLQYFWVSLWAVSKSGKSRQLWRGTAYGFGDPKKEPKDQPKTISGLQKEFGVKDQFVFLDGNYMQEDLVDEAARHGHWATRDGEREWMCWSLLVGSGTKDFSHKEDRDAKVRWPYSDPVFKYAQNKVDGYNVAVEIYYFSALQMGDMFARYRDGRGPETLFLAETESIETKTSWTAQINACTKQFTPNPKTGVMTEIWLPPTQTTPHHYWDVGRMFMCVLCLWGIGGYEVKQSEAVAEPEGEGSIQ